MAAPIYKGGQPFMSNIRGKNTLIPSSSAAVTLKKGQTGLRFQFDRTTGLSYTLPATPTAGLCFEFHVTALQASGANIVTAGAGVFLKGTVLAFSGEAVTPAVNVGPYQFAGNGTTHIKTTTNGTTSGGGIGGWMRFTCLSATIWYVEGVNNSPSGNMATPFST